MPLAFSIFYTLGVKSQSLITGIEDQATFDSLVMSIVEPLYNLEFEKANQRIKKLETVIPEHPIVGLLYAINITWLTIPETSPEKFEELERYLRVSLEKAEIILENNPDDPEANFFLLMCHGLLAQYYNEQGYFFKTISEAKKAYNSVIDGFDLMDQYPEYLFSSGLYNYYRQKYPELYPIYKTLAFFFKSGNKELGLEQLELARSGTVMSRVESAHYLAYIYIRYETLPQKAIEILEPLTLKYPNNLYFKNLLLEAYSMLGILDEARILVTELALSQRKYYQMCGSTFNGVLNEKYDYQYAIAKIHYERTIELSDNFENKDINALAMAYAGLARISDAENDKKLAKSYYKLAAKYAQATSVKMEAKEYIRRN